MNPATCPQRDEHMISFRVPCVPIAQPRPRIGMRFVKGGGKVAGIMRDDKHPVHAFKSAVMMAARQVYQGAPLEGPISFQVVFIMPRPQGLCRKKDPVGRIWMQKKPDVDNLYKGAADALNSILFHDDSQICRSVVTKCYAARDEQPGAEVTVEVME